MYVAQHCGKRSLTKSINIRIKDFEATHDYAFPVGRKTYGRPFSPTSLCFVPGRDDVFVAGGNNAVQVWTFEPESRKVDNEYVGLGKLKRNIKNMMVRVSANI